jgi:hypothetical protein
MLPIGSVGIVICGVPKNSVYQMPGSCRINRTSRPSLIGMTKAHLRYIAEEQAGQVEWPRRAPRQGVLPHPRDQRRDLLQLEVKVRQDECVGFEADAGTGRRDGQTQLMYADLAMENRALKDLIEKKL